MYSIILTEDDENLSYGLNYALKKEGYEVYPAGSLKEAEELLLTRRADLIILDVNLPDGSGFDFCKKLRERGENIPIVFLTACDDEVNVVMGLDLGGDDYITKPFKIAELLSRIRAVLRRVAVKDDENPELTRIEQQLVTLLKKNKNQVLTRLQILDLLWDNKGEFVDDNTLSVHISRLREKIGTEHVQTVRGVGYQWKD